MVYYVIKIDRREYRVRINDEDRPEVSTEIGWLNCEDFVEYLYRNEMYNALIELAQIGLDRILKC